MLNKASDDESARWNERGNDYFQNALNSLEDLKFQFDAGATEVSWDCISQTLTSALLSIVVEAIYERHYFCKICSNKLFQ